ncbi:MAG: PHP domain-containing protein [Deltaproteobacteria bacterium]|nr:PHP domain-containing protein [Candidatus Zymogenaceae bacterium]
MIDLHIHTDASSDGVHSPDEIFRMITDTFGSAAALSFADHDSVQNVPRGISLSHETGIPFVSGVELSATHSSTDVHILGYGIDHESRALVNLLDGMLDRALTQTERRVELLRALGFALDSEDVFSESKERAPTGRSFLAALKKRTENKHNRKLARYVDGDRSDSPSLNFYQDYLAGGKPAYAPISGTEAARIIGVIREASGVAILAHPGEYTDETIHDMIDLGIDGLEVWSGHHDASDRNKILDLARTRGLLITAGSDFHGKAVKPNIELGVETDNEAEIYSALITAIRHRRTATE